MKVEKLKPKKKTKSEFGKGLTYCLGLFLCHSERNYWRHDMKEKTPGLWNDFSLWFNGASDHFYELEIPKNLPSNLQKRLKKLRSKSLEWGHGFKMSATKEDFMWAINEAKTLLRLIDKFHKVPTEEATWE